MYSSWGVLLFVLILPVQAGRNGLTGVSLINTLKGHKGTVVIAMWGWVRQVEPEFSCFFFFLEYQLEEKTCSDQMWEVFVASKDDVAEFTMEDVRWDLVPGNIIVWDKSCPSSVGDSRIRSSVYRRHLIPLSPRVSPGKDYYWTVVAGSFNLHWARAELLWTKKIYTVILSVILTQYLFCLLHVLYHVVCPSSYFTPNECYGKPGVPNWIEGLFKIFEASKYFVSLFFFLSGGCAYVWAWRVCVNVVSHSLFGQKSYIEYYFLCSMSEFFLVLSL